MVSTQNEAAEMYLTESDPNLIRGGKEYGDGPVLQNEILPRLFLGDIKAA